MRLSIRDTIGIVLGVIVAYAYVRANAPVGWFDSVVGLILFVLIFLFIKFFKGFKR